MRDRLSIRGLPLAAVAVLLVSVSAAAQVTPPEVKAPALEVISVKQNKDATQSGAFGARPDGIYAQNVPLRFLLTLAFQRQFGKAQMVGVPEWADVDHFDVVAKVSEADMPKLKGLNGGPMTLMRSGLLLTVLRERFQLKTHVIVREGPVYALVIAKGGLKIKPAAADAPREMPSPNGPLSLGSSLAVNGEIAGHDVPFSRLMEGLLSDAQLDRVVVDRTGLTGNYDYLLHWKPDQGAAAESNDTATGDNVLPSLFTAIQEQLGLKLESAEGPIKTLVIDHLEKPSEN